MFLKRLGNLDWTYRHAIGDIDYGYRVRKAGFKNYVATGYLGIWREQIQSCLHGQEKRSRSLGG